MRRWLFILALTVTALTTARYLFAQSASSPNSNGVTTWQVDQGFVNYVNAQLASLQAQIKANSAYPLTSDVSAAGYHIQHQGNGTNPGDSIIMGQANGNVLNLSFTNYFGQTCTTIQGGGLQLADPNPVVGDTKCVVDWDGIPGVCNFSSGNGQTVNAIYSNGNWMCGNVVGNAAASLNATFFPGVDICAKVNAAWGYQLTTMNSTCGTVLIPSGTYTDTTTCAPPVTGHSGANYQTACQLVGEGAGNTIIDYTGGSSAFSQVITNSGEQNDLGAIIKDITIDGSGAAAGTVGVRFGGSSNFGLQNVVIQNFNATSNANNASGVYIENASGMYTQNAWAHGLTLANNTNGVRFIVDGGGVTTFRNLDLSGVQFSGTGLQIEYSLENGANVTGSIQTSGTQIGGSGNVNDIFCLTGNSTLLTNLNLSVLCTDNGAGCVRFAVSSGSTVNVQALLASQNYPSNPDYNTGTLTVAHP